MNRRLLILGFGGHARSVANIAMSLGISEILFFDAGVRLGENYLGHPAVNQLPDFIDRSWLVTSASGDHLRRRSDLDWARVKGFGITTLIAPSATIGAGSAIGEGCVVGHHAHISTAVLIGKGTIVNTAAIIEHESTIADFCHVSVNATIAGRCAIGENCFIGAGATVIDKITIISNVTVGAGACVISSLGEPGTYVGVPAKRIRRTKT